MVASRLCLWEHEWRPMAASPTTGRGRNVRLIRLIKSTLLFVLAVFAVLVLYLILLRHPGLFFRHAFTGHGIALYSDEPIAAGPASQVLERVEQRLLCSPLFHRRSGGVIRVYICNRSWRFILFANYRYKVGGLTYPPVSNNIFLRGVTIAADRLVGPSGQEVMGERTLSYFIAHEITHTLLGDELGAAGYWRLPVWKNEGYCDLVAKGPSFHYDDALAQLRRRDPEMNPQESGLYLRYNLLVAYLLDRKRISVNEMLSQEFDTASLEAEMLRKNRGS
jgi:hypothetical protein